MTKVTFDNFKVDLGQGDTAMFCLTVTGHAGYAAAGSDIVCAGVSTLVQALACSLTVLDARLLHICKVDGPAGGGVVYITALPTPAGWQRVRGMFEMALMGLHLLAAHYPEYVTVNTQAEEEAAHD